MTSQTASSNSLLHDVIEQRRAWIKSAMALEEPASSETVFVREIIERAQKLRLELAQDRYFSGVEE